MSSRMLTTVSTSTKFANEFLITNNAVLENRQDNGRHLINSVPLEYSVILLSLLNERGVLVFTVLITAIRDTIPVNCIKHRMYNNITAV
jgi:prophage DNA circulation protein